MAKTKLLTPSPPIIPITDVYQVAYLTMNGIEFEPSLVNEMIVFHFENDSKTAGLIREFNSNKPIPILRFTREVRKIRSQIYSMRPPRTETL